MNTKQTLHSLVDELPDSELGAAAQNLSYLRLLGEDPVLKAMLTAPLDDEPLTEEDRVALTQARGDLAAGRTVSHDEARQRLLGRP